MCRSRSNAKSQTEKQTWPNAMEPQSFLRSHSRTSHHFMELVVHYMFTKPPPLVPLPSQIKPVHTSPLHSPKVMYNILPLTFQLFLVVSLLTFPPKPEDIILLSYASYTPSPSHPPWPDYRNYIWSRKYQTTALKYKIVSCNVYEGGMFLRFSETRTYFVVYPITSRLASAVPCAGAYNMILELRKS